MTALFTIDELRHLLAWMNAFGDIDNEIDISARQKLEIMIAEYQAKPLKTQEIIGGHMVTREVIKK